MDPYSVSDPTLNLRVSNFDENNTTTGDLWYLLLVTCEIKGVENVRMLRTKHSEPCAAIVKFNDAGSVSEAVTRLNKALLKGEKIAVSPFVHLEYIIDDDNEKYKKFIDDLRMLFAHPKDGSRREYIKEKKDGQRSICPVLGVQQGRKRPARWIHIKLIAKKGDEEARTTLVLRDDNLYVKGFTGEGEQWFEIFKMEEEEEEAEKLPAEYKAERLWGYEYKNLMKLNDGEQVKKTFTHTKLGKAFAERAVRMLSRYGGLEDDKNKDDIPVRLGLAGLLVMICESARLNPILKHIADADCWKHGKGRLEPKDAELIWNWKNMSGALLRWKGTNGQATWNKLCGAENFNKALENVHLVLNACGDPIGRKAHVEILQVSANFDVGDINVIDEKDEKQQLKIHTKSQQLGQPNKIIDVSDINAINKEQKPQDIYAKEQDPPSDVIDEEHKPQDIYAKKQEPPSDVAAEQAAKKGKKLAPLEVIVRDNERGKPNGISGCEWFGIQVNRSPSSSAAGDSIVEMRWDCRNDGDATQLVTRDLTLGCGGDKMQFTYLVMSHAVQATVAIRPLLPADPNAAVAQDYTVRGIISASIVGDLESQYKIVLVKGPITFKSGTLSLARSAVKVPRGKQLQIHTENLCIEPVLPAGSSNSEREVYKFESGTISFDAKDPSATIISTDGRSELHFSITWKGNQNQTIPMEPDAACKDIMDKTEFTGCIVGLRKVLANGCQDVLKDCKEDAEILSDPPKGSHPVLKNQQRWIHVKLQAVTTGEGSSSGPHPQPDASVTLAIRDEDCCGVGFLNQSGVWYDLGNGLGGTALPGHKYNSVLLDWGDGSYQDVLGVTDKGFAAKALRVLSRYPDVEEEEDPNPRLALAGIILMVCESAKLNSLYEHFQATCWDHGRSTEAPSFTQQELMNHIRNWGKISRALLYWKDHDYPGSENPRDALDIVHLVYYSPRQIDLEYTINGDKERFTTFIKKLQSELANHEHQENVLDGFQECKDSFKGDPPVIGRWRRVGQQPARLFHIKLQVADPGGKTSSITLAVRDDTVSVAGFKNQHGKWYELGFASGVLPQEYKPIRLWWGTSSGSILGLVGAGQVKSAVETLDKAVGRGFATKAVRRLSQYDPQAKVQDQEGDLNPRLALLGLILMVCGSARFNTLRDHFAKGWRSVTGTPFSRELQALLGYEDIWFYLSRALLRWKKDGYSDSNWSPEVDVSELENMGIKCANDALGDVALVYNANLADKFIRPPQ